MRFADAGLCHSKESLCFWPEYNSYVSWPAICLSAFGYLGIASLMYAYMFQAKKPLELRNAMRVYNLVQIILSALMAVKLAPFLGNYVFNINGPYNDVIEYWMLVHFFSKLLDMFDTFFILLRQKYDQLTFLHMYHHATIGFIWGLVLHYAQGNGTAYFGAWVNSTVHAAMYSHYLWTSFGFGNPFKKYITQLQMLQFVACMVHALCVLMFDRQTDVFWGVLQLTYHITLLALFVRFYRRGRMEKRKQANALKSD